MAGRARGFGEKKLSTTLDELRRMSFFEATYNPSEDFDQAQDDSAATTRGDCFDGTMNGKAEGVCECSASNNSVSFCLTGWESCGSFLFGLKQGARPGDIHGAHAILYFRKPLRSSALCLGLLRQSQMR